MSRTASRAKTVYACAECGQTSPKWLGQCPACKQWNTMQEEVVKDLQKDLRAAKKLVSESEEEMEAEVVRIKAEGN